MNPSPLRLIPKVFVLLLLPLFCVWGEETRIGDLPWSEEGTVVLSLDLPESWTIERDDDGKAIRLLDETKAVRLRLFPRPGDFDPAEAWSGTHHVLQKEKRLHGFAPLVSLRTEEGERFQYGLRKGRDFTAVLRIDDPSGLPEGLLPSIRLEEPPKRARETETVTVERLKSSKRFRLDYHLQVPTDWTVRQAERMILFAMPGAGPEKGYLSFQVVPNLPHADDPNGLETFILSFMENVEPTEERRTIHLAVDEEKHPVKLQKFRREEEGDYGEANLWAGRFQFGDVWLLVSILIPDESKTPLKAYEAIAETFEGTKREKEGGDEKDH